MQTLTFTKPFFWYLAYFAGVVSVKLASGVIDVPYWWALVNASSVAGLLILLICAYAYATDRCDSALGDMSFPALLVLWFSFGILMSSLYEQWSKMPHGFSAWAGLKGLSHDAAFHSALTVGIKKNIYPSLLLNDQEWFKYHPLSHYIFAVKHSLNGPLPSWYAVITSLQMWIAPTLLIFLSRSIKKIISEVFCRPISSELCYLSALLMIFVGTYMEFSGLTVRSETQTLAMVLFFALFPQLLTSINTEGKSYRKEIVYIWVLLCALVAAKSAAVLFCAGFMLGSTLLDWRDKVVKKWPLVVHLVGFLLLAGCMWAVSNPFQSKEIKLFHFADSCGSVYRYFETSVLLMAIAILCLWVGRLSQNWFGTWYLKRLITGLLMGSVLIIAGSIFLKIDGCSFLYISLQLYWAALLLITSIILVFTLRYKRLWRVLALLLPLLVGGYSMHSALPKVDRVNGWLNKYGDAIDVDSYGSFVLFSPKPVEEFDSFQSWANSNDSGPEKYRVKCMVKPLSYTVIYEKNADISQSTCGYPGVQ